MTDVLSQFDYPQAVRLRFTRPQHVGSLQGRGNVVSGHAGKRDTGASIRLWLEVISDHVRQVRYEAYGCPHFIAAAESLATWCEGRPTGDLSRWSWKDVQEELTVPTAKRGRLLILENALKQAIETLLSTQASNG